MGDVLKFEPRAIIPERKSDSEMQIYREATKKWSDDMKKLIFPFHYAQDNS